MKRVLILWQRDLTASFVSATAYVSMIAFLIAAGFTFLWAVERNADLGDPLSVVLIVSVVVWLPILVTVITMGTFADEKRSGMLEALLTTPVSDWEVVLGKYLAAYSLLAVMIAPTAGYLWILGRFAEGPGPIDVGALVAGYGMLALFGAFCVAVGVLVSLLTRHQVVAALCTFCLLCLPFAAGVVSRGLPRPLERVMDYVAAESHIVDFARGLVDSRPIVLYITATALVLFVAVRALESRRWT
jgi:ABC-2 type transport system permease protein